MKNSVFRLPCACYIFVVNLGTRPASSHGPNGPGNRRKQVLIHSVFKYILRATLLYPLWKARSARKVFL